MSINEKLGIDIVLNLNGVEQTLAKLNSMMNSAMDVSKSSGASSQSAQQKILQIFAGFQEKMQKVQDETNRVFARYQNEQQAIQDKTLKASTRYYNEQQAVNDRSAKAYAKYLDEEGKLRSRKAQVDQQVNAQSLRALAGYQNEQQAINQRGLRALAGHQNEQQAVNQRGLRAWTSYHNEQQNVNQRGLRALSAYLEKEKELKQQAEWNRYASTQGIKYQAVDGGFVRSSVQTQNLSEDAMRRIRSEADQMNTSFRRAAGGASFLNISLSKMAERLAEFYSIRTVLLAIGGQLRDAVSGALDFNQAIHDIAAISGESRDEMGKFGDSILNIATHSRYTAKEVAQLMELLAQAGVASKDLPSVSSAVGMFATASGSTPEQAADVYTTAANVFGISADKSTRVTNVLTAALNESKLTVQGLGTAFNYLAPQAAQLGLSLEDTAGIIATMSQAGVKASTIGTGVSQMLKEFAAPKARLTNMLDAYGIDPKDVNPKLHSFADIVDTLKSKGVATEHLFQALESRVGRSVVAAVNLGGDAFRNMTDSVTGTSSAVVAYDKAMEGARARMNVMKQEVQRLVIGLGEIAGPVAGGVLSFMTDFIRGLQTTEGKAALAATALGVLTVAMRSLVIAGTTFNLTNPIMLAVTALGALAGAFAYLGNQTSETTQAVKKSVDEHVKHDETTQRVSKALRDAHDEKKKYGSITDATRASLVKLKTEYPTLLGNLDLEKASITELTAVYRKLNQERVSDQKGKISEYNNLNHVIETKENDAKFYEDKIKKEGEKGAANPFDAYFAGKIRKEVADLKTQRDRLKATIDYVNTAVDRNGDLQYHEYTKPLGEAKDPLDLKGGGKGPKEKSEIDIQRILNESEERIAKLNAEEQKIKLAGLKDTLKNDKDLLAYKLAAEKALNEEYAQKEKEAILDINQKLAGGVGAKYTPATLTAQGKFEQGPNTPTGAVATASAQAQKELNERLVKLAAEKQRELDKINNTKLPDGTFYTSLKDEKTADATLRTETQRVVMMKEQVWNADQLKQLTIDQVTAEINNKNAKESYIKKQIEQMEKARASAVDTDAWDTKNKETLEAKKEDLRAIVALRDEEARKLQQIQSMTALDYAKKGAGNTWARLSNKDAMSEQLGGDLVSSTFDGITNSLNGMVNALEKGGNAWKAFKTGLGNMMKQIADILQQYIIKMMVVYAVQNLIGMSVGTTAAQAGNTQVPGSTIQGNMYNGGSFPIARAEGGMIPLNMGIPGKDSVPILSMPGEFVVRKESVDFYGAEYFEKLNAKKFAAGGLVGGGSGGGPGGQEFQLVIINVADPTSIPKTSGNEILNVVSFDIERNGPVYKQLKAKLGGN